MPDFLLLGLAFALGYLVRIALSSSEFRQLRWRIAGYLPRRCPTCRAWHQKKTLVPAKHKVAGWTLICINCYNEQYHPFSEKEKDHSE